MSDTVMRPAAGFEYYKGEIYWNNFDQVDKRMKEAVSGDPAVTWAHHLRRQYGIRDPALFIGCGNGWVERDCFHAGLIRSAIGFDVLPELVATAAADAQVIGMPARYFQADGNNMPSDCPACELIVNHGSMHHVAFVDKLTRQLAGLLKPGGIYVINDYTGPHRNQYSWEAVSRTVEINHSLPEEYRVKLGYAHIPTMLALDPTEAIHSELQMDVVRRYFEIITHVRYGGAIAYSLLFQNRSLHRDQRTDRGAACIARILEADQSFLNEMPHTNLFTFAVCTPKAATPGQEELREWSQEEVDREARARANGGRYYPATALELIYNEFATLSDRTTSVRNARVAATPISAPSLSSQPRLAYSNAMGTAARCKICESHAPFFDVVDFNKCASFDDFYAFGPSGIVANYYRCSTCGFVFTPLCDDWTGDKFRQFIYNDDYILVDPDYAGERSSLLVDRLRPFLAGFESARILDYGSGSGGFGAHLAAAGFGDVESYDPFSQPRRPHALFDIITCIEVIEHAPDPLALFIDMRSLLAEGGCILFSQTLQPPDIERIRANWWYCAPRNGHVSTYTDRALSLLAERVGLTYHRNASSQHMMRMAGDGAGAILAARIGAEFRSVTLGAPHNDGGSVWHEIENYGRGMFRWSAEKSISWHIATPPGAPRLVQIRIPYEAEVRPGIAAECRISIGGVGSAVEIRERSIFAEVEDVAHGQIIVTLELPEILRPADLGRNDDSRMLGLAIRVVESATVSTLT